MEDNIQSQFKKAQLPPFGSEMSVVPATVMGTEVSQTMENQSLVQKNAPLSPTEDSMRKANADIRKEVEKGLTPMIASKEAEKIVRQDTGESERREVKRMETVTAAVGELSTRQAQEQVMNRVDQRGRAVQRPRLAQGRAPSTPAQAIAKKGMSKALKYALIGGGTSIAATGGILGITSLFT
jgi:hypothetical protein